MLTGGVVAIVTGSGTALLVVLGLWRRLRLPLAMSVLAACGGLVGVGALLVQGDPGPGDWAIAPAVLGALTPLHARLVFGPPGARDEAPVVAPGPLAA